MTPENLKLDIEYLQTCVAEGFKHKSPEYVKPEVLNFGSDIRNGKEFKKEAIIIDIEALLDLICKNAELDQTLAQSNYEISLAMYHDEILLVNPIGNS